ncbi:hypothetical protein H6P81_001378 [Aristolochia fimbriata]|uniref:Uncharacterized protein n=1 Tax=Aristolochia fimbriata TaxID=158543 RepID=A0AAV7F6P5_ARIFI|nr:hypothetical protein H6P81_001378 [Aristolochia fimbriata]
MGAKPENDFLAVSQHTSVLQQVLQTSLVKDSLVHSYRKSFNGFAAKLTEEESRKITGMKGVTSVFPSVMYKLHTTRSWDFLGLTNSIERAPSVESDIIVGVFDTGVWPESKSFNDSGLGPPPKKWKGVCMRNGRFKCNNKIIGARFYARAYTYSAMDEDGHGSHVASTIAGSPVQGASLYGIAEGEARGGVPSAKIAVYKTCTSFGCSSEDILAGFDDAIADGVDIISLSLGADSATQFFDEPIAIGSFHAMAKGILTSTSAGNSGPGLGSVSSVAPWILTVAASTIDRSIISKLVLDNGTTLVGNTISTFPSMGEMVPVIKPATALLESNCNEDAARICMFTCLDRELVKGKILLCEEQYDGNDAREDFGALGVVTESPRLDVAKLYPLPTTSFRTRNELYSVYNYVNTTRDPRARILKSECVQDEKAPSVASFSSRGPNTITSQILKPDISAPGVDILAAWSPIAPLTGAHSDKRSVNYHIISGTSMSCPHATAAAAYVKSFHPDWSPAAIKSALMTTATPISQEKHREAEFAYGSGNINPVKATNPGLVFNSSTEDYIQLLCSIGYTTDQVQLLSGDNSSCSGKPKGSAYDLNYPSVAYKVKPDSGSFNATFSRTVTNVGNAKSVYTSKINLPQIAGENIEVRTVPGVLDFTELNQKKDFKVVIGGSNLKQGSIRSFPIEWSDGEHVVGSERFYPSCFDPVRLRSGLQNKDSGRVWGGYMDDLIRTEEAKMDSDGTSQAFWFQQAVGRSGIKSMNDAVNKLLIKIQTPIWRRIITDSEGSPKKSRFGTGFSTAHTVLGFRFKVNDSAYKLVTYVLVGTDIQRGRNMASILWFSPLAFFTSLLATLTLAIALDADRKVYIVYMGAKPENELLAANQHTSLLQQVLHQNSLVQDSLVYSYKKSFNAFAAKLTEEESRKIAGLDGVTSVFPNGMYKLHTTRSWDFLNFTKSIKRIRAVESDLIVGVLDTGAWPESKSFDDHGLDPPPKKWKGACKSENFTCNNKIIGARVYPDTGSRSARDELGHGTHTASTVAGRTVHGASLYGIAEGDARGGVPSAKIAVYKVCSFSGCSYKDILAAFDDAIDDGVDIISLSLGPSSAAEFLEDPIAIGSFHALANRILTSNSAGNSGPGLGSVSSVAPWILTVAATTTDRSIISKVALGNGKSYVGNAINTFASKKKKIALTSGVKARSAGCDIREARSCVYGCLDPKLVKGKILLCEGGDDGTVALQYEARGLITETGLPDIGFVFPLPTAALNHTQLEGISSYINKTRRPRARILKSESAVDKKAPAVASFSSRGPNPITPRILKPDISAPGVDILAAWSPVAPLTDSASDNRSANYHIISGTSMSCPHATAAAAYVKSFHPDWSPSAIKSALMTTGTKYILLIYRKKNEDAEFAYGSGNINPVKATDPGLVFDSSKKDYIQFLCSIGYTTKQVRSISGDNSSCSGKPKVTVNHLNYPSVAYKVKPDSDSFKAVYPRTVKNVGKANSVYTSRILPRKSTGGIEVRTVPRVLKFTELNQKKSFNVAIKGSNVKRGSILSFSIEWTDGKHVVYIVYMGAKPENELLAANQHTSLLQQVLHQNSLVQNSLVYSYKKSFNAFVAKLTEEESRMIAGLDGVTSVFPNRMYKLHTTRSWDFLNFTKSIKRVRAVESNLIVGVFDTGAWPESESFDDHGLDPPPKKWKGVCKTLNFTCNNKIIGARVYPDTESRSARDEIGHGTHTASTVAGRTVHGASLYGIAEGDARGGVPSAKIAVYKVCSFSGCSSKDILAAFDDAIDDGVDLISLSLGPSSAGEFLEDPIAIGSFHALANGILTSNSAGNSGPGLGSVSSVAPWILTVAATTTDRSIISKVALGNGKSYVGNAINTFSSKNKKIPLISGARAKAAGCNTRSARSCVFGCLDEKLVKGKILLCEGGDDGSVGLLYGARGILTETSLRDVGFVFPLPAAALNVTQLEEISSYIHKTRGPRARILKSESAVDKKAPAVASFSSRGPNPITPRILKPDISAPGVDILAAWSPVAPLTDSASDNRSANYHIISGTSMSCPHATAAAAYVKSFHPDWSPSAIKSALMTTATPIIPRKIDLEVELAYGSGNINPVKAINPGLVFDASKKDYIQFLCSIGYGTEQVRTISGDNSSCSGKPKVTVNHLNYPSAAYMIEPRKDSFKVVFPRTVKNVGTAKSVYTARILPRISTGGIEVRTVPRVLKFTELNQKKSFKVVIKGSNATEGPIRSFSIEWADGKHVVRIPVVVY